MRLKFLFLIILLILPEISSEESEVYQMIKDYPWVTWTVENNGEPESTYLNEILEIEERSKESAINIAQYGWIKDYITREEGEILESLYELSQYPDVCKEVTSAIWLYYIVNERKKYTLELIYSISTIDEETVLELAKTTWFKLLVTKTEIKFLEEMLFITKIDKEFSRSILCIKNFRNMLSILDIKIYKSIEDIFLLDRELGKEIVEFYKEKELNENDYLKLNNIYELMKRKPNFVKEYLENGINDESLYILSSMSLIEDEELFWRIYEISELKNAKKVEYLSKMSKNKQITAFSIENYLENDTILRFLSICVENNIEDPLRALEYILQNPEIVYENEYEAYRYDMLLFFFDEIPENEIKEKNEKVNAILDVYAPIFYDSFDGLSSNGELDSIEKEILLLIFYELSEEEPYSQIFIPYEYSINLNWTISSVENTQERGTFYIFNIYKNLSVLSFRRDRILRLWNENPNKYLKSFNELSEFIIERGNEKDKFFIFISNFNWEKVLEYKGNCNEHTYQTLMDCKALGIPCTYFLLEGKNCSHIYPAYKASESIIEEIERNSCFYGYPLIFKGYISPLDSAGFRKTIDENADTIKAYDFEKREEITLWKRGEGIGIPHKNNICEKKETLVLILFLIILFIFFLKAYLAHR